MINASALLESPFYVSRDGLKLAGTKYASPEKDNGIPVIISHGFLNTRENVAQYARQFAAWGFTAYTFDFAGGSPKSESDGKFADMSVQTEKQDLFRVMDYVREKAGDNAGKLILMGCSQGGFVSAMAAAERPDQVNKLILFYPALCIPDDARRGKMMFFSFNPDKVPECVWAPGTTLALGRRYIKDAQALNAFTALSGFDGDVLFVHGTEDKLVDIAYSEMAATALADREGAGEVHMVRVNGAGHGFEGRQQTYAMQSVRQFLLDREEILTVDVRLIKPFKVVKSGTRTTTTLPFDGRGRGNYFEGVIQPGAADVQVRDGGTPVHFRADYTLTGVDCTGTGCTLHVINETDDGIHWHPTVSTDSYALAFLNDTPVYTVFESRKGGPLIHLYA